MKKFDISVIPGDGIGVDVTREAVRVLDTVAQIHGGLSFSYKEYDWGCDYYLKNGVMMPEDGLQQIEQSDAVFLGAVGDPNLVPDHISLWGLLVKIRRGFEQAINVRPAKQMKGIASPLTNPNDFDFVVVRENSEGEYSEVGGRMHSGENEMAIQNAVFTRKGTENAMKYAFELAKTRDSRVTSATKSNGIIHSMPFGMKYLLMCRKIIKMLRHSLCILMH